MSRSLAASEPATAALFEELADGWTSLAGRLFPPRRVEVLKKRHDEPEVCRLHGCAPGGGDLVAKRCTPAAVEPLLYEHVLAAIPGCAPRFHGIAGAADAGQCWLFIEHVRGDAYLPADAEHRGVVANWLGTVHSTTSAMPLGQLLPERGAAHYRDRLRCGLQAIAKAVSGNRIDADDQSRLAAAVARCLSLERQWDLLEAPLQGVRPGLVHGDLVPKNSTLRRSASGVEFVAFDWETAGWGVPVADLAVFSVDGRWRELPWTMRYPEAAGDCIRRASTVGRAFRLIASIAWEGRGVCSAWPRRSIRRIASYSHELGDCMRALAMEV